MKRRPTPQGRAAGRREFTDADVEEALAELAEADEAIDEPAPADAIPDDRPRHTPLWAALSRLLLGLEAWLRSHGGRPLRRGILGFWAVVAGIGVLLLVGPVINPPLTLEDVTSSASEATDRWIARSAEFDYSIDRDADGRLIAAVEERITAFFPEDVDETGIVRVLATEYQGHALTPTGIEVTLDGEPITVTRRDQPTRIVLDIDAGERLTGDHDVVIRYVLHDLAYEHVDSASGQNVQLLEWDVFGPSWPQGFARLAVTIDLSEDLDEQLVRAPRGSVAWLILSAGTWLEPEPDAPAGRVVYAFENEQNIPPHANAWFTFVFTEGTFTLPGPSTLFLIMSFGPLLPLAILLVTLLFALAARAVAWSDARGRPWYVAQSEPPEGVGPALAVRVLGAMRVAELAEALSAGQTRPARRAPRSSNSARRRTSSAQRTVDARVVETVARRAGLWGDLPRAIRRYFLAPAWKEQYERGLRRVPRGFVRDWFIAAPIAITLVQWGLVRQLSHQEPIAVVWWPLAFVLVSMLIAIVIIGIALSAHPLTRTGAVLKQHLLGVGVYAERTLLLERTELTDPLVPYAILTVPPRHAARRVLGLVSRARGGEGAGPRVRMPQVGLLLRPVIALLAIASVAGSITYISVTPNPLDRWYDYRGYDAEIPGTLYTRVTSFEAIAELTRDAAGRVTIEVTERMGVSFEEDSPRVPQFAQQWPAEADGQSMDLEVTSVRLDGEPAPFAVEPDADTLLMRTEFAQAHVGEHELEVTYRVGSAAVAAHNAAGAVIDRIRWAALLDGWRYDSMWDDLDGVPLDPFRIELRVPADLVDAATRAGWVTRDPDGAEEVRDWPQAVVPFGQVAELGSAENTVEAAEDHDGVRVYSLALAPDDEGSYPWLLTIEDLGVMLDFPAGTFAGPEPAALDRAAARYWEPIVMVIILTAVTVIIAALALLISVTRGRRGMASNAFRTAARWLAPATGLSAAIVGVWLTVDIPADDREVAPVLLMVALAIIAGIASAFAGLRGDREAAEA